MKANRASLWVGGILLGLLSLFLLLPIVARVFLYPGILGSLALGWLQFLLRNVPQITVNYSLTGTGILCSVLVVVLGNCILRALFDHPRQATGAPPRRWRWRWTTAIYCGVWLLFIIAIGAAGILRHAQWLLQSQEPWYKARGGLYGEIGYVEMIIRDQLLSDNLQDLATSRHAFLARPVYSAQRSALAEDFDVIFYGNEDNKVAAYVIIPRTPRLLAQGRFYVSEAGRGEFHGAFMPISKLEQTVAEFDAAYPAAPGATMSRAQSP